MARFIHAGRQFRPSKAGEMAYRKILMAYVTEINALFKEIVAPELKKAKLLPVNDAVDYLNGIAGNKNSGDIIKAFAAMTSATELAQNKAKERFIRYMLGINAETKAKHDTAMKQSGFILPPRGKIAESEGITDYLRIAANDNAKLITNMATEYKERIEKAVLDDYLWGKYSKDKGGKGLMHELKSIYEMTDRRARLIARDQNNKINGSMNAIRAQVTGAIGYRWHNVGDQRVRGNPGGIYPHAKTNHWDREGQYYLFEPSDNPPIAPNGKPFRQPPAGGFPGSEINCRCYIEPVYDFDIYD